MKKIELTMSNGKATLKIVTENGKTDVSIFGLPTLRQKKVVEQMIVGMLFAMADFSRLTSKVQSGH